MKEKFSIEYALRKGSLKALWNLISTTNGLSEWMADRVERDKDVFTFYWGKGPGEQAELIDFVPEERIRFHWMHEPSDCFFEISLHNSELTGEITLLLTDFAEASDKDDAINLWNSEIESLIRRIGM